MPQLPLYEPLGVPFIELQSIDSTNNYALTQLHAGLAQHGTAFFAHEQVAGKGQRGKTWTAEKDDGLILSIVIDPHPMDPAHQFGLSAWAAVSTREFFANYAGDATAIKWPNDIYWHDRKAGGILIENIIKSQSSHWQWAVTGIGININQASFPDRLSNPVSLRQVTGHTFDSVGLARELCVILEKNYQRLVNEGVQYFLTTYNQHLYKRNEQVRLKKGSRNFQALIKGVTPTGKLVAQHALEEEFGVGEVEWVLPGVSR